MIIETKRVGKKRNTAYQVKVHKANCEICGRYVQMLAKNVTVCQHCRENQYCSIASHVGD